MPAKVIDVAKARTAGDLRDVVHRAVQALSESRVVAFPTETIYGLAASALDEQAVERLVQAKGRAAQHPFALAVKSVDDALDYVPDMPVLAQRLARRCWPGPLTLVLEVNRESSLVDRLPAAIQQRVCPNGTLGLRVPASALVIDALRLMTGPLALTSANQTGGAEAVTAEEVMAEVGEQIDLVLDDGRCQFGQASTVVQVTDNKIKILRQGVISPGNLRRLGSLQILFVCTGNTCRSPMAEALARKILADRLGCKVEEVEDRGFTIASAGIAAMNGGRAALEAVDVLAEQGLNLNEHISQPLREPLIRQADYVFTLTASHRHAILSQWPDAEDRVHVLSAEGEDVSDPIGGTRQMYAACAEQIGRMIETRIDQMDLTESVVVE